MRFKKDMAELTFLSQWHGDRPQGSKEYGHDQYGIDKDGYDEYGSYSYLQM
jgi:hypothetical protein